MTQYIDKDAVVAEIKRKLHNIDYEGLSDRNIGQKQSLYHILSFIDTLEVKEVDLDFEKELYKAFGQVKDFTLGIHIAKHFFELGMQVNNPITASDRGKADEIILALKTLGEEKMISYDKEIEWLNKLKEL